jgi:hypothetical protein
MSGVPKEPAPPGYRYIVRQKATHKIVGVWNTRPDACQQAWDLTVAVSDGRIYLYIEELPE